MIQMTGTRHRPILAVAALAVMAMTLAGCGRKGPLEPPPSRATTDTVVTTDAPPTVTPVP